FSTRAEYQKARDTQRHSAQACQSWSAAIAGKYRRTRRATEKAQAGGSGTEVKIGGDRDAGRCQRFRERLSSRKTNGGRGDYDDYDPSFFRRKKAHRRACGQISVAGYLLPEGVCRRRRPHVLRGGLR